MAKYIDPKELEKINLSDAERKRFQAMVGSQNKSKLKRMIKKVGKAGSNLAKAATGGKIVSGVKKETKKRKIIRAVPKSYAKKM